MRHMGNNECFRDVTGNAGPQEEWEYTVKSEERNRPCKKCGAKIDDDGE